MREARAVVFPSVWHEPAGLITLEAAALGRPVIASAVGGIPEYATDAFALRVPPRDVDGLAHAMSQLAVTLSRPRRWDARATNSLRPASRCRASLNASARSTVTSLNTTDRSLPPDRLYISTRLNPVFL